ncbi:FAD-dependent oxidoreductase, partial [Bacillus sp. S34]|nr:FAD-dependent oxidoreductase [Bacillus sp. S34]
MKIGMNTGWPRVDDPDLLDRTSPDALFDEVRDAIRTLVPGVVPEVVRAGVYMDGYTADHDAFVGPLGWDDRVTVLGGFSGHGFKLAPAMGIVAADHPARGALAAMQRPVLPEVADVVRDAKLVVVVEDIVDRHHPDESVGVVDHGVEVLRRERPHVGDGPLVHGAEPGLRLDRRADRCADELGRV